MSLLKLKKSDRSPGLLVPPWHPNFRNFERLPDVKVVRTSFFVNGVAVAVTLALLACFGLQEYKLHEIRLQADDWQHQIEANQKASAQAVQLYQKFQAEEKKSTEAGAFVKADFVLSNFIIELAQTLPKNIGLDYIEIFNGGVTLRGTVRGSPDEAFSAASAYIDQLRANPHIGPNFENISFPQNGLNRSAQAGQASLLKFELSLKAKKVSRP
jgi:hypothetical protein